MKSKKEEKAKENKITKVEKTKKKSKKQKVSKTNKDGFFKSVIKELKKVKWPDKKYMVKYSAATFGTIILSSLYFYLIYMLFTLVKELR